MYCVHAYSECRGTGKPSAAASSPHSRESFLLLLSLRVFLEMKLIHIGSAIVAFFASKHPMRYSRNADNCVVTIPFREL